MEPVAADLWRITTPLPFRPRSVHAYLARTRDRGWLLVDGGADTDAAWASLDAGVHEVAGGWDEVRLHLVTHMHLDHLGLTARVRDACCAPLAMGELDALRSAHAAARPGEEAEYRAALLREAGAPADLLEPRDDTPAARRFVPVDHPLAAPRATVPTAAEWSAVWTPGHTAGHVSLFRSSDGALIGGDAVLPRITPTIGVNRQRQDPVGDYLDTLARLAELAPTRIFPGHGDPIDHPAARLEELRTATVAETDRVAAALRGGAGTAWEATRLRYAGRELPAPVWMQALRETMAHLHHLLSSGRAHSHRAGSVVRFWPR